MLAFSFQHAREARSTAIEGQFDVLVFCPHSLPQLVSDSQSVKSRHVERVNKWLLRNYELLYCQA